MNKPIYALSIKQPWAWLICRGFKDIENRNWRIGREPAPSFHSMNYKIELPARIYVHAGKTDSDMADDEIELYLHRILGDNLFQLHQAKQAKRYYEGILVNTGLEFGAIIGEVTIYDCVTKSSSPWFVGKYGFVLSYPVLYDKPIPCRGSLGFFKPEIKEVTL